MKNTIVILTAFLFVFAVMAPIYAHESAASGSGAVEKKAASAPPAKKKSSKLLLIAGGAALVAVVLVLVLTKKSKKEEGGSNILVDQNVTVGAGGGFANVTFNLDTPGKVRITLTAADTSMEPYGNLELPNGTGTYCPPNGGSVNGTNTAEIDLPLAGFYYLTIFDGSNRGGSVHVKIEKI